MVNDRSTIQNNLVNNKNKQQEDNIRKLFSPFVGLCLLFFLLSACSSTEEATDFPNFAMNLSEEFIDTLYTVDDADFVMDKTSAEEIIDIQNEYKPYLTEDEFEELSAKRLLSLPEEVASQLKNTISVEKIKVERNQQTKDVIYIVKLSNKQEGLVIAFTNIVRAPMIE